MRDIGRQENRPLRYLFRKTYLVRLYCSLGHSPAPPMSSDPNDSLQDRGYSTNASSSTCSTTHSSAPILSVSAAASVSQFPSIMPTLITKAALSPSNPISLTGRCGDSTIIVTAYGKSRSFTNLIAAHTPGKDSIATLEIPPIYMTFPDYSEWSAKWLGGELKALDVATFWQDRPNSDRNVIRPGIITVFMEVYHEQTWRFSNIEASSLLTIGF